MSVIMKAVGFDLLKQRLAKIENDLRRREQLNQRATVVVDRWIQENFQSQGQLAMGGAGWKPLSQKTLARRRTGPNRERSHRILEDTGRLKGDWKHLWTANLAKVQAGVDYADEHHFGKGRLPVRRILPLDRQIWPRLEKLFQGFIRKVIVR